ncbi:hypothetical protein OOZ19_16030, partial [Saccharopolyspora sp. NFXS83]|nr:hypothetical protein [Saccharopolyspora sp. NFXS83]
QDQRGGMPMMPPMMPPGAGGAGGGGGGGERSDASGLLDAGSEPWAGSGPPVGDPEAPFGAPPVDVPPVGQPPVTPPAENWSPGQDQPQSPGQDQRGGMPMMPPMMPPGAGGAGGGGSERSDASGLLDAGSEPWAGSGPAAGDPEAPFGAPPISAPPVGEASPVDAFDENEQQAPGQQVGGGMPMMPPMMPPGAGGLGGGGSERSDASGLLDAGSEPWASAGPPAGEPEAPSVPLPPAEVPSAPPAPQQRADPPTPVSDTGQVAGGVPVVPLVVPPLGALGPNRERERSVERPGTHEPLPDDSVPADADADVPADAGGGGGAPAAPVDPAAHEVEPSSVEAGEPELPQDHVPVVRHDDVAKDTGAWDSPGGLPWLLPFPVSNGADRDRERPAPDHSLRDTTPWEAEQTPGDSGYAAWRRASLGGDRRVAVTEERPPRCGGPDFTPEELAAMRAEERAEAERQAEEKAKAEAEADAEEEKERSSSDLLVRDNSAWGGGSAKPPPGALG